MGIPSFIKPSSDARRIVVLHLGNQYEALRYDYSTVIINGNMTLPSAAGDST